MPQIVGWTRCSGQPRAASCLMPWESAALAQRRAQHARWASAKVQAGAAAALRRPGCTVHDVCTGQQTLTRNSCTQVQSKHCLCSCRLHRSPGWGEQLYNSGCWSCSCAAADANVALAHTCPKQSCTSWPAASPHSLACAGHAGCALQQGRLSCQAAEHNRGRAACTCGGAFAGSSCKHDASRRPAYCVLCSTSRPQRLHNPS